MVCTTDEEKQVVSSIRRDVYTRAATWGSFYIDQRQYDLVPHKKVFFKNKE
jgi:hypothetical protein